jgi:Zn-dependent protease
LLVSTATVLLLKEYVPGLFGSLLPPGSLEVDGQVSAGLFFVGFAMVATAQLLGTKRQAAEEEPASPTNALRADAPEDVERVCQAVAERMSPKKTTLGHTLTLFTISMFLFVFQLEYQGGLPGTWVLALFVVLFVHELGHLLAMWAFGYSELRMFFIPMFGAAVSGRKHHASATERAIVSLMGPAPGLVFALAAVFFEPFESRFLHDLTQLALIINAFNLLPFVPLDGGNLLDVTLFARWSRSRTIMGRISGLALAAIGLFLSAWILVVLGLFTFLVAGSPGIIGAVAGDLREKLAPRQTATFAPPTEAISVAISSVNKRVFAVTPLKPTPKRYANVIVGAWPRVRSLAPSVRGTLLLLGAYFACLFMAASSWSASAHFGGERGGFSWHAGGQPRSSGKTGSDGPDGEWSYWYANGLLRAKGRYVEGVKNGPWHDWHNDGRTKSEGDYEGGQKVGIWSFQDEEGVRTTRDYGALPPDTVLVYDDRRTQIRCHFDNTNSAEAALDCAESAFRAAERFLPPTDTESKRAEFHLFRERDDYRLAEWRETTGRYKDDAVFTLYGESRTYTYVSPRTSDEELDRIGLPDPTLGRIARAAALHVLVWRMPAFRELPTWLKTGFRAYVARRATNPSDAALQTAPWFTIAEQLASEGRLPSATVVITTDLEAFTKGERYAIRAALFEAVAQDSDVPQLFATLANHAKSDKTEFATTLAAWLSPAKLESLNTRFATFLED